MGDYMFLGLCHFFPLDACLLALLSTASKHYDVAKDYKSLNPLKIFTPSCEVITKM